VRVDTGAPLPVQIDGELGTHTPLDVEIRPGALRLLV
jgi:diacylglycerol kinase family enzyme